LRGARRPSGLGELVEKIRQTINGSPFHGEGYRKVHARGPRAHDGTITTTAPDRMWGTDARGTSKLERLGYRSPLEARSNYRGSEAA